MVCDLIPPDSDSLPYVSYMAIFHPPQSKLIGLLRLYFV